MASSSRNKASQRNPLRAEARTPSDQPCAEEAWRGPPLAWPDLRGRGPPLESCLPACLAAASDGFLAALLADIRSSSKMDDFSAAEPGMVSVEIVGRAKFIWRALGRDNHVHEISRAECRRDTDTEPVMITFLDNELLTTISTDLVVEAVAALDHLTACQYRAALLFSFCRDHVGVMPGHRLGLNLPSISNMIAAILYWNAAALAQAPLHAPTPDLAPYYASATQQFLQHYAKYVHEIRGEIDTIARMYLALVPPLTIIERMTQSSIEFTTLFAQDLLMQALSTKFAPPTSHDDDFMLAYGRLIEKQYMELHEALIARQMRIVNRKALKRFSLLGSCHDPPSAGYQTLFYDDGSELRQVTFRTSLSIMNNCGLTAWPAGFVLAEFCIQHQPTGQRLLELGSGAAGLVSVICSRYQTSAFFATDFNDVVLEQLRHNLTVNDSQDQVAIRKLDWFDIDDEILAEARPDMILLADTIYSPDLIPGQVDVIARAFALGAQQAIMANCVRQESSFRLLMDELKRFGLRYETVDSDSIPSRFCYVDRPDNITVLRVTPS